MSKFIRVLILCLCCGNFLFAQSDITGKWYGVLNANQERVRLMINLQQTNTGITGILAFPDRATEAKRFDSASYKNGILFLQIKENDIVYIARFSPKKDSLSGRFLWGNIDDNLVLTHRETKYEDLHPRPQEPKTPYPYYKEEVSFRNDYDSVRLTGTFVRPAGAMGEEPVVVMIPGFGKLNRDNEVARHKMFLVMADYFAKHGIASLRYDTRGVGGSGGDADSVDIHTVARDAAAAVKYLRTRKDIDIHSLGLLGHGEGATAAQIVAADNPAIAFVVSMAGMGVSGREMLDQMMIGQGRANNEPDNIILSRVQQMKPVFDAWALDTSYEASKALATRALENVYDSLPAKYKSVVNKEQFTHEVSVSPEMLSILRYKPLSYLKRVKCPFMAINGNNDHNVDADTNLKAMERALTENGNMMVTIRKFAGLNYRFQPCKTCTEAEYAELDETIDPLVPEFITHWILQLPPVGR
ncbi:S9 family peptidase [Chitinophaga sp. Cy-1792]|uniref:alpha/beta hydrolase family protein n=1 Tax=Chitinophaga sp. Cy-1792 TaxID=2608339 RepID=UPI00141FD837|nr:CocE/NonD family hydrolase [Chitinophaga sp. Cy-1792]NIG57654.1 hypothetical protein [Chitinophaga sp. Cy-1792]